MLAAMPASLFAQTVNVDLGKEYQLIRGFGGINFPAWVGDLTESQRATAFDNGNNQLGLSVLRIHVNPDESQWKNEIATAQYAIKRGALVFASPWNPPSSMTESYKSSKRLKPSSYAAYAEHLAKFVKFMKNNGVELYAISIQNEPDYGADWTWWDNNSMADMCKFLKENAKSIGCRIMAPEAFQYSRRTTDPIIQDQNAWKNVDILATHLYGTQVSQFNYPLYQQNSAGKELWMTEVYYPNSSSDADTWPEALEVADHIGNAMAVGNFQTYVWWYIRRSYSFIKDNGNITKRGYCMAQYSKFIRPGSVRIDATQHPGNDNNLNISAYKKDNDVVIVAVNRNTSAKTVTFSIPNSQIKEWERYVTDANRNVKKESSITGSTSFSVTLDAKSAVTLVGAGMKGMPKVAILSPTATDKIEIGEKVEFKADASDDNGTIKSVKFYDGTTLLGESTSSPYSIISDLEYGAHTLKAVATDNEGNEVSASIAIKVTQPQAPFEGTPYTIPGKIEAENFDLGGNGISYYDTDDDNKGEIYRTKEEVDITAGGDNFAIGWTIKGEWLEYTVNVETTDVYEWVANVSCSNNDAAFRLYIDGEPITDNISVENFKSWDTYSIIRGKTSKIEKGQHVLRLEVTGSYFNIDWLNFNSETAGNQNIAIDMNKHQGEYTVYSLDGKGVGTVNLKNDSEVKVELKKLGIQNGTYVLTSNSDTFKVEIME